MTKAPIFVAYGGGVNSTAMLVEMSKRGIKPDWIVFADTGGERSETYETVRIVSEWCESRSFPKITTVRNNGPTLEQDCLTRNALPSVAYGFKTCSDRWKVRPQNAFMKEVGIKEYRKAIGFDAGEERRIKTSQDPMVENWYPLVEWNLWREECEAICVQEGLPIAKSACFFCPSSKKFEILQLAKQHPELIERAIAMENNAKLTTVKGLGRSFAWRDFLNADKMQLKMDVFMDSGLPEVPCGCYDG